MSICGFLLPAWQPHQLPRPAARLPDLSASKCPPSSALRPPPPRISQTHRRPSDCAFTVLPRSKRRCFQMTWRSWLPRFHAAKAAKGKEGRRMENNNRTQRALQPDVGLGDGAPPSPPATPISGQLPGSVLPGHGSGEKENQPCVRIRTAFSPVPSLCTRTKGRMQSVFPARLHHREWEWVGGTWPLPPRTPERPAAWEAGSRCSERKGCSSAWLGPTPSLSGPGPGQWGRHTRRATPAGGHVGIP